jgi:natural product biosynthesis luciferase-like monooxygenase protein
MDGARFADRHGFEAVWTPERHFHGFGGLYPNPSVTSAAVAAVTDRVGIRAGSVVAPLHHPLRIAEEWSVVDNLSNGRVGISLASGWNDVDFALRPEAYADRQRITVESVDVLRRLWRGEPTMVTGGGGERVEVRIYPPPVQPTLPIWITSGGSPQTFRAAGRARAGVLTHLVRHDVDELAVRIGEYRDALREADSDWPGHVTLMIHTFLGDDTDRVRQTVREPLQNYLASSLALVSTSTVGGGQEAAPKREAHVRFLVERAFDRYFQERGLFGTVDDGLRMVRRLAAIGVDEVACLIDFGVACDDVLDGLEYIARLKDAMSTAHAGQLPD